ncbi:cupin domain-containing protein [Streptomyces sp. NPDC044571]|uniref:cupin domain-containing protein n=1 Tax=Streptomyces sp. NPDC044571 TaxID=3155371 RepID=UPI0033EBAEF4
MFIALSGRAVIVCNGRRHALAAGDIALMKAGTEHHVVNEHGEDFSYYAIWWGRDMSADFLAEELRRDGGEPTGAESAT